MFCISISYKSAQSSVREKLAFSKEKQLEILSLLTSRKAVSQCVLLCTCNRTEIYFCGEADSPGKVRKALAAAGNTEESLLSEYLRQFQEDKAIKHLFKVASGMDSMVVGEDEILGQTKTAYMTAVSAGTVSYEMNMIFQSAIGCAKKIKTETELSKTSVSVATLAANQAAAMGDGVKVLVIGATGKTGLTVVKNLLSHKNVKVTATKRQHNSSLLLSEAVGAETADYSRRYELIDEADCVISATSSPHYTITRRELEKHLIRKKDRLFIDLAVPADIEEDIDGLWNIRLIGIDYFQQLAADNNARKLSSLEAAEDIIEGEISSLKKELIFHDFLPFADKTAKAAAENFSELLYKMKSCLEPEQLSAVLELMKGFGERK